MKRFLVAIALAVLGLPAYSAAEVIYTVPTPADCSAPVAQQLNAFIASVPNGTQSSRSVVSFQAGGCYLLDQAIRPSRRSHMTFDGNGATFRTTAPNDCCALRPQWFIERSTAITLQEVNIFGNHVTPGPQSSGPVDSYNIGVYVSGGSDIIIRDSVVRDIYGDGIQLADAWKHDPVDPTHEYPSNVRINRVMIDNTMRMGIGVTSGHDVWIRNSLIKRSWYHGIDLERDTVESPFHNLYVLNNTIRDFFGVAVMVPTGYAPGSADLPVHNIEVRNNSVPTLSVASVCNQGIAMGGYPGQVISDVWVDGNTVITARQGMWFLRTDGMVSANTIDRDESFSPSACDWVQPYIGVSESPNLVLVNNQFT